MTPSPVLEGYRNKNEFTFGRDAAGLKTAGFQLARYATAGEARVGSPAGCLSAPPVALAIAELVTAFARERDDLSVWDKRSHSGLLRLLTVRNSPTLGQLMVVVQVSPQALGGADSEAFAGFKRDLLKLLVDNCYAGSLSQALIDKHNADVAAAAAAASPETAALVPAPITAPPAAVTALPPHAPADGEITDKARAFAALYGHSLASVAVEHYNGVSNVSSAESATVEPLFGGAHIYDLLAGMLFRVDYRSFFQVRL